MFKIREETVPLCTNRVATILRMVSWTFNLGDGESLPVYHVDGESNIADLLTKEHPLGAKDVSQGSLWQSGPEWLSKQVSQMPIRKYDQIFLRKDDEKEALKECFSEPFMTTGVVETLPPPSRGFSSSSRLRTSRPARMVLTYPLTWFATVGPKEKH